MVLLNIPDYNMGRRASNRRNGAPSEAASDASHNAPGRVTRSRSKKAAVNSNGADTQMTPPSFSSESASAVSTSVTPTVDGSENGSATPPTSDANTPNSSIDDPPKFAVFQPASSRLRLEISLSSRPLPNGPTLASDSIKSLKNSKFSIDPKRKKSSALGESDQELSGPSTLAPDSIKALKKSKFSLTSYRESNVFGESEEEDDDVPFVHINRDAALARKLQRAEDMHHAATWGAGPSGTKRRFQDSMFSDLTTPDYPMPGDANDGFENMPGLPPKRQRVGLEEAPEPEPLEPANTTREEYAHNGWDDESDDESNADDDYSEEDENGNVLHRANLDMNRLGRRRQYQEYRNKRRAQGDRGRLEAQHPILKTMWPELEAMPIVRPGLADQPVTISRNLKPFQLEGLAWMMAMEQTKWKGGLLGDEMGLGKTIQAVSLIMSDYPAKKPTLVLVPPVALMQWMSEIESYTNGSLKTFVFHGTNARSKRMTVRDIHKYDVIIMSYNSLESIYRKQEKGFTRKDGVYKEESVIHSTHFHRIILDEAHCIKTRSTMTAKACFALKVDFRWCLTGTPLQNRIGEFFSLLRFLEIEPFSNYVCRDCKCCKIEWSVDDENYCTICKHRGMRHVSVFNQELLNPIQRYGNFGPGQAAFRKLRLLTDRIMLRRLKKDHTNSMELPVKEIVVDRQFFSEVETDFANSIMSNTQRQFDTYVADRVMLNNYANIFGLIMQMRQVADHPDLILRKNAEGSQNVLICCICDEPAEEAIRSKCKHDFCRQCAKSYLTATEQPDCPRCHIALSIDLEQPEMEQDELMVKKSSIINRIRMENWTSSSKIELLVHNLYRLRSDKASHKSIIFSQFTTMLQLIEWRLRRAGITTVMLDGSMTPAQRQASIDYFKKNVDVECFLVSLKAGGVALNLTEASRVFIVDPWWNPAAEWQSADRCHRIGQTRPCIVSRLCIEDSVESRMVLLQEKKTKMINSTINSDDAAMESLTPQDLQFLFRGG